MQEIDKNSIRNRAALAGAVLGVVSGGYIFVSYALAGSVGGTALTWLYWLAKLVGCIWIMRWFMQRFCRDFGQADNTDTRKLGTLAALYSAIITAACSFIALEYVFPDAIQQQLSLVLSTYGSMFDSNTMSMMEKMGEKMGVISSISNLFWCFLYGWILSIILSSRIPSVDPFANVAEDENEDNDDETDEQ